MISVNDVSLVKFIRNQSHIIATKEDAQFCNTDEEITQLIDVCYVSSLNHNLLLIR